MYWKQQIEGHECTLMFRDGKPEITCGELLGDKRYPNEEAIARALKDYDLKLRKDFTNTKAFTLGDRWRGERADNPIREVTVSSIISEREAWIITADGSRRKEQREGLYADRAQVEEALRIEKEAHERTVAAWKAVQRWQPQRAAVPA